MSRPVPPPPPQVTGAPAWPRVRPVLLILAAVSVALVAISYLGLVSGHPDFATGGQGHRLIDVGVEANIPTWWTSTLLALGAAGAVLLAGRPGPTRSPWLACAAGMAALSLDELASILELLFAAGDALAPGAFAFSWLAIGLPLAAALAVAAVLVARRLPARARVLLLAGVAVFLAGAVGLEWVGSELTSRDAYGTRLGVAAYHVEELLEMLGATLMCLSPLSVLSAPRNVAHPTL